MHKLNLVVLSPNLVHYGLDVSLAKVTRTVKTIAVPYFACIQCSGNLEVNQVALAEYGTDGSIAEIITGTLACAGCAHEYEILNGVPRFLEQELSGLNDLHTGARFADAWREFPRMDARYRIQFFDWIAPVNEEFVAGKVVLEAGCGKGRHAQNISDAGAGEVFAVDIGDAVDVAFINCGRLSNVHIVQADIKTLPFRRSTFDFIFSVGVLHHMEDPETGFSSLVPYLRQNGSMSVWVYGRENNSWLIHLVNPIRVAITAKLSPGTLKCLSAVCAAFVYAWAKMIGNIWVPLQSRFRFLPDLFYERYMAYISRFDFIEIHHIVFDHLIAPVSHYLSKNEVMTWFKHSGMSNPIIRWHNQNSWTGFWSASDGVMAAMNDRLIPQQLVDKASDRRPYASDVELESAGLI